VCDRLIELSGSFSKQKYVLGDAFSMADVALAPLLWRLDHYGIDVPKKTGEPLLSCVQRVSSRQSFVDALTPTEKLMRR
jgi:RNA polymerase-associated protein